MCEVILGIVIGIAKAAVFYGKTYAFTVQNNLFWNAKQ